MTNKLITSGLIASLVLATAGTAAVAAQSEDVTAAITAFFAHVIERYGKPVMIGFAGIIVLSIIGITMLSVENRFIDYFKEDTEIYQGMSLIDNTMGGTTPLDIIIDAPVDLEEDVYEEEDSFLADLLDDIADDAGITTTSYWFNEVQLKEVEKIHDYLDSLPETGKVLSIVTAGRMLETLNEGETNQIDYTANYIYYDFHKTHSGVAGQEIGVGMSFPHALGDILEGLTPSYYIGKFWLSQGGNRGAFHVLGLIGRTHRSITKWLRKPASVRENAGFGNILWERLEPQSGLHAVAPAGQGPPTRAGGTRTRRGSAPTGTAPAGCRWRHKVSRPCAAAPCP